MLKSKTAFLESIETATLGEMRLAQALVIVREESPFKVGGQVPEATRTRYFVGAVSDPSVGAGCAFGVGTANFIQFNREVLAGEKESLEDYPCVDPETIAPGCEDLDDTFFSPFIDIVVDTVNAMGGYKVGRDGRAIFPEDE